MWNSRSAHDEIEIAVEAARARNGGNIDRDWAHQFLIAKHADEVSGSDCFAYFAMSQWCANAVREYCNRIRRPPNGTPWQRSLEGFENLKSNYSVERDGVLASVPVQECTDDELLAKAALYRANASSLIAEADDLERYVSVRNTTEQPA